MDTQTQADALQFEPLKSGENANFWREARYDDLECLSALFRTHSYQRHTHETYVIGCIVAGCELFELDGVQYAAGPGDICFVNPEAVHDGRPAEQGYAYRMIYPSLSLIQEIAQDISGSPFRGTPHFPTPIIRDPALSSAFVTAHQAMQSRSAALHTDELMLAVLGQILKRYVNLSAPETAIREHRAVSRAKEYLAANVTENVDLVTLASVCNMSRSHLIRAFKAETGLTPHAFLVDRRVRLARKLLVDGHAPVDVALTAGFSDQAHMTRAFKARIGVTPGLFARMT